MIRRKGWLHVIAGPMFSGKTEEVIRLLRRHEIAGDRIGVFRPEIDDRSSDLVSRSGAKYHSRYVKSPLAILTHVALDEADIVAIDEAQFFDEKIVQVAIDLSSNLDKHVIVSGLDKDFSGRPFGFMPELLAVADQVTKLTAICSVCHDEATMTQRLVDSRDTVVVGGLDDGAYTARCKAHHSV